MDFHGNSVHHIGYGHPKLKAAIAAQMDALPFAPRRFACEAAVDLAEELGRITPDGLDKVLFTTGGSDAVEVAMKMALTAKPITAEQALEYGMVAEVTAKGEALNAAVELANAVAKNAPLGLIASKELLREMQGRTEAEFWQYQQAQVDIVFKSADGVEGATAFAEKRAPNWKGV